MDREAKWGWMPAVMPTVQRMMAERRRSLGDAHVNACWRAGVVQRLPDRFYAREGAVAVGTPGAEFLAELAAMDAELVRQLGPSAAGRPVLMLAKAEVVPDGAK